MKKFRSSLAVLAAMVVVLIITSVGFVFSAQGSVRVGNFGSDVKFVLNSVGDLYIYGEGDIPDYEYGQSPFFVDDEVLEVEIENTVKKIGSYVFYGCKNLKKVTIKKGVDLISDSAFGGCASLKDVYYSGSNSDFGEIEIGADNECLQNAALHSAKCTHLYEKTVTQPTCTENGFTTYTCTLCKESYVGDIVPALGHSFSSWKTTKKPNCTQTGLKTRECSLCGKKESKELDKTEHTYKNVTVQKATTSKNGKLKTVCTVCGKSKGTSTLYKVSTISVSSSYGYTGKEVKPTVTVKDSNGKKLKPGTDYTVSYKNNVKLGSKASAAVKLKGSYSGSKTVNFNIVLGKVTGITASQTQSTVTLTWNKTPGASGYNVYSYNTKTKKSTKIKTVKSNKAKLTSLKSGTTYVYKVRAVKENTLGIPASLFYTATKPDKPKLKIALGKNSITVSWDKVKGASGYIVYTSQSESGEFIRAAKQKSTSYTIKNPLKNQYYYFKVTAYKTVDNKVFKSGYALAGAQTEYTNSPLVGYTCLSPNHSGTRTHPIDRITPHCVVGQLTAENICGCFMNPAKEVSSNYNIGTEGKISMSVEEKNRSWCSSSEDNDQRAITIECASDNSAPYKMNKKVYKSLVDLCTDICQRNGKTKLLWFDDKEKSLNYQPKHNEMIITVHCWFANKDCPGQWLYSRLGKLADEVTDRLQKKQK